MSQRPSVGRVVHYQKYGTPGGEHKSEPSAAVITKVNDRDTKRCQLFVMNPNGVYFNDTPYSEMPKPGHWSWPPRHNEIRKDDSGKEFYYDEFADKWLEVEVEKF